MQAMIRILCGVLTFGFSMLSIGRPVLAERVPAPMDTRDASGWLRVTVLELNLIGNWGGDLSFEEKAASSEVKASPRSWRERLGALLRQLDQVVNIEVDLHRNQVHTPAEALALERAKSLLQAGISHWKNLDARRALVDLDMARVLYEEGLTALMQPRELADIEFHRGLALLDIGERTRAEEAFARMFELEPGRRFERGYFGAEVEASLKEAWSELATRDLLPAHWPVQQLRELARRLRLDAIVLVISRAGDSSLEPSRLDLAFFDVDSKNLESRQVLEFGSDEYRLDAVDRALSRWHSCALDIAGPIAKPRAPRRLNLDVSYTHGVWLKHRRTRDFLQGPGAQIGLSYSVTPGLEIWARTSQRATLSDANGDLLDVFATTHFATGIGLDVGSERWRFLLRAGLDLALSLSDITMTTDVDCKFFGPESARCGSLFQATSPAAWLGLDFSLGVRFAPMRSWYGLIQLGLTSYVLTPDVINELNFPLYGNLGFGLPF